MRILLHLGGVLLLCAALAAPAAASLGEITKVEEGVVVVHHYALSELPAGTVVTLKRMFAKGEAWARGVVVSMDRTACTARIRLEGPRKGPALVVDDRVLVTAASSDVPSPAFPGGTASRALAPGQHLRAPGPRRPALRLPTMMFPLGDISRKQP